MQKEEFKLNGVSFQKRFVTLHETEEKWLEWASKSAVFAEMKEPARTECLKEAWKLAQDEVQTEAVAKTRSRRSANPQTTE